MTRTTTTWFTITLLLTIIASASIANASEVTGTLSSNSVETTEMSGSLNGTVATPASGSSGGGSSRSTGYTPPAPTGSVLGAATNNAAPSFPNAGNEPTTFWSLLFSIFNTLISF